MGNKRVNVEFEVDADTDDVVTRIVNNTFAWLNEVKDNYPIRIMSVHYPDEVKNIKEMDRENDRRNSNTYR